MSEEQNIEEVTSAEVKEVLAAVQSDSARVLADCLSRSKDNLSFLNVLKQDELLDLFRVLLSVKEWNHATLLFEVLKQVDAAVPAFVSRRSNIEQLHLSQYLQQEHMNQTDIDRLPPAADVFDITIFLSKLVPLHWIGGGEGAYARIVAEKYRRDRSVAEGAVSLRKTVNELENAVRKAQDEASALREEMAASRYASALALFISAATAGAWFYKKLLAPRIAKKL